VAGAGAGGDGTHQADPAAHGDRAVAPAGEFRADLSGQLQPAGVQAGRRRAEDADRGHRYCPVSAASFATAAANQEDVVAAITGATERAAASNGNGTGGDR